LYLVGHPKLAELVSRPCSWHKLPFLCWWAVKHQSTNVWIPVVGLLVIMETIQFHAIWWMMYYAVLFKRYSNLYIVCSSSMQFSVSLSCRHTCITLLLGLDQLNKVFLYLFFIVVVNSGWVCTVCILMLRTFHKYITWHCIFVVVGQTKYISPRFTDWWRGNWIVCEFTTVSVILLFVSVRLIL